MLTDLIVAAAFSTIIASVERQQQMVQYKYCTKTLFAKHKSKQQHHLKWYYGYLQNEKDIQDENSITCQAKRDKILQLFLCIINLLKRRKLDWPGVLAVYCDSQVLSIWKNTWIQKFFTQGIEYKSPNKEDLVGIFPDKIYLAIMQNVNAFLLIYDMINIVSDKNNNQAKDKIRNMTILTKNNEFFHIYSKSSCALKLTTHATAT